MQIQRNSLPATSQKIELHTFDEVRQALDQDIRLFAYNHQGHGERGVYCTVLGWTYRVVNIRVGERRIEVQTPAGDWLIPSRVYCIYQVNV